MNEYEIFVEYLKENYNKKVELVDRENGDTHIIHSVVKPEEYEEFSISFHDYTWKQSLIIEYSYTYDEDGYGTCEEYVANGEDYGFSFEKFEEKFMGELCAAFGVETSEELEEFYNDKIEESLEFLEEFKNKYNKFKLAKELKCELPNKNKSKSSMKI